MAKVTTEYFIEIRVKAKDKRTQKTYDSGTRLFTNELQGIVIWEINKLLSTARMNVTGEKK